jgi:hypothetical protein
MKKIFLRAFRTFCLKAQTALGLLILAATSLSLLCLSGCATLARVFDTAGSIQHSDVAATADSVSTLAGLGTGAAGGGTVTAIAFLLVLARKLWKKRQS